MAGNRGHAEAEFLAAYHATDYAPLAVAVDVVFVSTHDRCLHTLLVRRDEHPFKGRHALPGGFVGEQESLEAAAARVGKVKAGIDDVYLEQLFTFGRENRDPRMRVVTVAYYALLEYARFLALAERGPATAATVRVPWQGESGGPVAAYAAGRTPLSLAFDHADILGLVVKRLRGKLTYVPLTLALVGETFTLLELQRAHEAILGRAVNKDGFRRKMLATGWLRPTGRLQSAVLHRPAELYAATAVARKMLARP